MTAAEIDAMAKEILWRVMQHARLYRQLLALSEKKETL